MQEHLDISLFDTKQQQYLILNLDFQLPDTSIIITDPCKIYPFHYILLLLRSGLRVAKEEQKEYYRMPGDYINIAGRLCVPSMKTLYNIRNRCWTSIPDSIRQSIDSFISWRSKGFISSRSHGTSIMPASIIVSKWLAEGKQLDDCTNRFAVPNDRKFSVSLESTTVHSLDNNKKSYKSDIVVVLDMDECLIHSRFFSMEDSLYRQHEESRPDSTGEDMQNNHSCESFELSLPDGDNVHVIKRPNLDEFLKAVTERYETYIFTAALEVYARPLLEVLDPDGSMFSGVFYRESCAHDKKLGVYVKDLSILDCGSASVREGGNSNWRKKQRIGEKLDQGKVVLVDNNPTSFLANPLNAILVPDFHGDPNDSTLDSVVELLRELESHDDVRPVLDAKFGLKKTLKDAIKQSRYGNR